MACLLVSCNNNNNAGPVYFAVVMHPSTVYVPITFPSRTTQPFTLQKPLDIGVVLFFLVSRNRNIAGPIVRKVLFELLVASPQ